VACNTLGALVRLYAGTGTVWENPTCGLPMLNPIYKIVEPNLPLNILVQKAKVPLFPHIYVLVGSLFFLRGIYYINIDSTITRYTFFNDGDCRDSNKKKLDDIFELWQYFRVEF
jgi:hypothetical protein